IAMAAYDSPADTRQHIQTQLQRADRLVSDMLVYSGGLHLQISSVPLAALVNNLLSQSDTQQVNCQVLIADDLHMAGDFQRLQQVFINLIDNALAYVRNMPDGKLLISAQQQAQQVVIQLHNNGPAIESSVQGEAMFQPFVTKRSGGSGLGLAIVRRIVEAHGGRIRHRSDCHWPVTFELSFPQPTHSGD
ncbi:sensor histidine kinase, partial [Marinomonas sp.]